MYSAKIFRFYRGTRDYHERSVKDLNNSEETEASNYKEKEFKSSNTGLSKDEKE